MEITHVKTNTKKEIVVELLENGDYKNVPKSKYWFNWKTEKGKLVYKLRLEEDDEILGLISLIVFEEEKRFEISLLAVSKENRGKNKIYEGITGNLIAYACREAIKLFEIEGCVSLIPKSELKKHYIKKYGMIDAGWQLFLEGKPLLNLLKNYQI